MKLSSYDPYYTPQSLAEKSNPIEHTFVKPKTTPLKPEHQEGGQGVAGNRGSRFLMLGGGIDILARLMVVVLFLLFVFVEGSVRLEGDNDSARQLRDTASYVFLGIMSVDIIAYFFIGIGLLIFRRGSQLSDDIKKAALVGGVLSLIWAFLTLSWRFLLPATASGEFIELFDEDLDVATYATILRMMAALMIISSFVFPAAIFYLRRTFKITADRYGIQIRPRMLSTALVGSIINLVINLIWQIPIMVNFMAGETIANDLDEITPLVVIAKVFILPYVFMIGSYGVIKSAKALSDKNLHGAGGKWPGRSGKL